MQLLLLKFLFAALLCFVCGIVFARKFPSSEGSGVGLAVAQWRIFRGFCLYAFILGLVGMIVPQIWWPWFHLFICPLLIIILLVILITAGQAIKSKIMIKSKKNTA